MANAYRYVLQEKEAWVVNSRDNEVAVIFKIQYTLMHPEIFIANVSFIISNTCP